MFALGSFSRDSFYQTYWRKKPLFLKGGAHDLLNRTVTSVEFRQICDRMERSRPELILRRPGCIFAQNMNVGSADFEQRASAVERSTSCRRVWFDGVYATDEQGIGSHFDHSDNFVLQQSGVKKWRLCAPTYFSKKSLRQRMLESPQAGLIDRMPNESVEFIVEPGDLLYIPLFWGHEGISMGGRSVSISLVMNADNPLDQILPLFKELLSDQEAWWQPMPQISRISSDAAPPEALRAYIESLVEPLGDPAWRRQAVDTLLKKVYFA